MIFFRFCKIVLRFRRSLLRFCKIVLRFGHTKDGSVNSKIFQVEKQSVIFFIFGCVCINHILIRCYSLITLGKWTDVNVFSSIFNIISKHVNANFFQMPLHTNVVFFPSPLMYILCNQILTFVLANSIMLFFWCV